MFTHTQARSSQQNKINSRDYFSSKRTQTSTAAAAAAAAAASAFLHFCQQNLAHSTNSCQPQAGKTISPFKRGTSNEQKKVNASVGLVCVVLFARSRDRYAMGGQNSVSWRGVGRCSSSSSSSREWVKSVTTRTNPDPANPLCADDGW